tara:strand:+ start:71584 stop:72429 length:846 start_codon:yes stop_codon:yes gene_type:complete
MPDNKTTDTDPIVATVSTTCCRKCVFADYEGNTQVGCTAGRLEVFEKNGVDFICVGDEEKTYYLIKDKACPYFRHVDGCEEILKSKTIDELKETVKSSLKMAYHVLIFLREGDSLEDLEQRLSELEQQVVEPKIVSVIDRTHSEDDLSPKIVGLFHNHYSFDRWRTQRVAAVDQSDMAAIDVCYDNTKSMKFFFYTIFEASKPIPASFSEEIHYAVQEKMESFVILEPNSEGNGTTVLKAAHAKYGGNSFDIDLKDKIIHYDDSVHLIRKVEDICPSLRTY